MERMTQDDVRRWALGRGFVEKDDGILVSTFRGVDVEIVFLEKAIRLQFRKGDVVERRTTVRNLANLHVDEAEMLEGLGLSSSFATAAIEGDPPPWFTEEYVAALQHGMRRFG